MARRRRADPLFISHRGELIALAVEYAIPTMYYAREFVSAGGLVSYASTFDDSFRRAATYVARVLEGREASRFASDPADQVRTCDKPKNRERAGLDRAADHYLAAPTR
jgi:putative ABC transport system substrate-binding protein